MNTQNSQELPPEAQSLCKENWQNVIERVHKACDQAGRDPISVRVIGVTKYVDTARTKALYDAGCRDLGESRPRLFGKKPQHVVLLIAQCSGISLATYSGIKW